MIDKFNKCVGSELLFKYLCQRKDKMIHVCQQFDEIAQCGILVDFDNEYLILNLKFGDDKDDKFILIPISSVIMIE